MCVAMGSDYWIATSYIEQVLTSTSELAGSGIRFASGVPVITVKTNFLAALKTNGTNLLICRSAPLMSSKYRPAQNPTKRHALVL